MNSPKSCPKLISPLQLHDQQSPTIGSALDIEKKRQAALQLLATTGMWRSNYLPPLFRFLWSLGIDIPPPHFARFLPNVIISGCFFGATWAILLYFLHGWPQGTTLLIALQKAGISGALFGIAIASYYAYGKRKFQLPDWKNFSPAL